MAASTFIDDAAAPANSCVSLSLSDETLDLNDIKWEDIHVITGALKMFFRELPEPLFTFSHFNDFVNAISKSLPKKLLNSCIAISKHSPMLLCCSKTVGFCPERAHLRVFQRWSLPSPGPLLLFDSCLQTHTNSVL